MDVFQEMANTYDGNFSWSKEGALDFLNYSIANYALSNGRQATLLMICGFGINGFSQKFFYFLSSFYLSDLVQSSIRNLRDSMYTKITLLPLSFFLMKKKEIYYLYFLQS